MTANNTKVSYYAKNDTSWFDNDVEYFFSRDDFKRFEELSGVKLNHLISSDKKTIDKAKKKLIDQSVIFNEIRNYHAGYAFPLFVYTHSFDLFEKVPKHNPKLDKFLLSLDMCDSLRRRHIALSHVILPKIIKQLYKDFGEQIVIKNQGSGMGLDLLNATRQHDSMIKEVINYDIAKDALKYGEEVRDYLESKNEIGKGKLKYICESLMKSPEKAHCVVLIGVICGLTNIAAEKILQKSYNDLHEGGVIVLSAANKYMRSTDPLSNFVIQHIGSKDNPDKSWGLNFRTKEELFDLLVNVGFKDIEIHDDANYPDKDKVDELTHLSIDNLPAEAKGHKINDKPLALPDKETFKRSIGYNWIAIAKK